MTVEDLYPDMDKQELHFWPSLKIPWLRKAREDKISNHAQCGILWFYHIPKCGGTAVGEWLGRMQANGYLDAVLPLMSLKNEVVDFDNFRKKYLDTILVQPTGK